MAFVEGGPTVHIVSRWYRWNLYVHFNESVICTEVFRYLDPGECNLFNFPRTPFSRSSFAPALEDGDGDVSMDDACQAAAAASEDKVSKGLGTVGQCRYSWAVLGCLIPKGAQFLSRCRLLKT